MLKIKASNFAGMFYPSLEGQLVQQISSFNLWKSPFKKSSARAVIAPHAGYIYSGELADFAIRNLDDDSKNIFIFAPAHKISFSGLAVCDFDEFETPLGKIKVNNVINAELAKDFGCKTYNDAFQNEHAVEVQLPLIQSHFKHIKIVPIVVGDVSYSCVTKIIEHFWDNTDNAFLISSDLSHFHSDSNARMIDRSTCNMIENAEIEDFSYERACGAISICGLIEFARAKNFSLIRLGYRNSGDVTGDKSSVVSYGAWMLFDGTKNKFIKDNFSEFVVSTCRGSIKSSFSGEKMQLPNDIQAVFQQDGASFVTLTKSGNLRGCIGSIYARQSLIDDLISNARSAAFSDPRFDKLTVSEFEDIEIKVSLLSNPQKIFFDCEQDFLKKIVPFKDGVVIKEGFRKAVYLPCVWEQIPDKTEFLDSLKQKAGLPRNYFSDSLEAFIFSVETC